MIKLIIHFEVGVSVIVALLYLYFGCIITRFVEEFLPPGMIPANSITKTRVLFYFFSIFILLRSVVI